MTTRTNAQLVPLFQVPSLWTRIRLFARHGWRIATGTWPGGYTFQDLAAIQDSLDGPAFTRMVAGMWGDPDGARVLRDRPRLAILTAPWDHLSSLPVDTFGYNLWHHFYTNNILQVLDLGEPLVRWDEETEYVKDRYRSSHDARHVLVGVGIDGHSEVLLQAFQCGQNFQILSAAIATIGGLKHGLLDGGLLDLMHRGVRAWRMGRRTRPLIHLYFEELWEVPLEELRAQLGITPIGECYPVKARHPTAPWTAAQVQAHHAATPPVR